MSIFKEMLKKINSSVEKVNITNYIDVSQVKGSDLVDPFEEYKKRRNEIDKFIKDNEITLSAY